MKSKSTAAESGDRNGSAPDSVPTATGVPSNSRTFFHSLAWAFSGFMIAALAVAAAEGLGFMKIGWDLLAVTIAIMGTCQLIGAVFQHFPSGAELSLFRLGVVAICRTLLPLVVFAPMAYNGHFTFGPAWGLAVVALYLIPLICTLIPVFHAATSE